MLDGFGRRSLLPELKIDHGSLEVFLPFYFSLLPGKVSYKLVQISDS